MPHADSIIHWLTADAPYWVVLAVCRLLGDWFPTVCTDGCRVWLVNGKLHRVYGPAVIHVDGSQSWWRNGRLHRDGDAPAIIHTSATEELLGHESAPRNGDVVFADDTREWWRDGCPHRNGDMPAIIRVSGTRIWFRNGLLHRDGDMPAAIYVNGEQEWYREGKRYRREI